MPKGIYERTKPTGFLHPWNDHRVSVDGVGEVYKGRNKRDAHRLFDCWVKFSKHEFGRASGKRVTLTINGKIESEHKSCAGAKQLAA